VRLSPETCRVKPLRRIKTQLLHLVGLISLLLYRVIRKSLRDIRPLRYSSRDGHAEGEQHTPSFCPTSQVLDMSTLGDAADVNPVISSCHTRCTCVAGTWLQGLMNYPVYSCRYCLQRTLCWQIACWFDIPVNTTVMNCLTTKSQSSIHPIW